MHVDVLIVGAGISGIGAAHHLQDKCPGRTYAILEARDSIGGTWDLFRYPGIRSDSDMHTLGYRMRPWTEAKAIADGPAILSYVDRTAREEGIHPHIRLNHRVLGARWSSEDTRWTVDVERTDTGERVEMTCSFLFGCCGYYRYDEGYTPELPGIERYAGTVVHPQHWPEDLDYAGKRVVVIGSGATAVTLVPAMAEDAEHVMMLQRSPSYVLAVPGEDPFARFVKRHLSPRRAYRVVRWKNVALTSVFYRASRRWPDQVKKLIRRGVERQLPEGYDVDTHFKPRYNPWDQRMCIVPDGDLFEAIREGRASVATDRIETFTESGIRLRSGAELEADIVVTATGLQLLPIGGMKLAVDGAEVKLPESMTYKSMMLSDVPNFAFAIGYTNASWTLKVDLTAEFVCRLLNHMDAHGHTVCVPERDPDVDEEPILDFTSSYVLRAIDKFPKQGARAPWRVHMNYFRDLVTLRFGSLDDGAMRFSGNGRR
jgi:monooxygenase